MGITVGPFPLLGPPIFRIMTLPEWQVIIIKFQFIPKEERIVKKVFFFFGILISMLFVSPAFSQFAQSAFIYQLYIDGIDGDGDPSGPGLPRPIDILAFKEGVTQTGTAAVAAGRGAGRAQFADLNVTKRIDKASVRLKSACASGQHIKRAILVCFAKSGKEFYRVTLGNVMVTGVKFTADHVGGLEEVTFNYAQIEWQLIPIRPDGSPGAPIKGGYDLYKMGKG